MPDQALPGGLEKPSASTTKACAGNASKAANTAASAVAISVGCGAAWRMVGFLQVKANTVDTSSLLGRAGR